MSLVLHDGAVPSAPAAAERRPVITDPDGCPVAYGWLHGRDYWLQIPEVANFSFRAGSDQITAFPASARSHEAVVDAYHTIALPLALQVSGFEALHASAVDFRGKVVAFCGTSESGKTTTAYALGQRGFPVFADDAVICEARPGGPTLAHPIPFSANLRRESRHFFDFGDGTPSPSGDGEADPRPLGAVVLLERVRDDGQPPVDIRKLPPVEALPALVPHSHRFNLDDLAHKRRSLQNYLGLVAHVPVLRARFVPDLGKLHTLLDELERTIEQVTDPPA